MAIEQGDLSALIATSIDEKASDSLSDIFLGLTKTAGQAYIQKRLGEASPPVNQNASRTDTAVQELAQNNREAMQFVFTPQKMLYVAGALGLVLIAIQISKRL